MRPLKFGLLFLMMSSVIVTTADAQLEFEQPPISYSNAVPANAISRLQEKLDNGSLSLAFDDRNEYLRAVLKALEIPESSQALVFSKTSLQLRRITPQQPRAVYFNDN